MATDVAAESQAGGGYDRKQGYAVRENTLEPGCVKYSHDRLTLFVGSPSPPFRLVDPFVALKQFLSSLTKFVKACG